MATTTPPAAIEWRGDTNGVLRLLDQTRLPGELAYVDCRDVATVFEAIRSLRVRGAPAIGIAAAYGLVVAMQGAPADDRAAWLARFQQAADHLAESRPTAVNLFWAIDRLRRLVERRPADAPSELQAALLTEARAIHDEDRQMCRAIGRHGADLLGGHQHFLTHCNTGGLATSEYGTALSVFFTLRDRGARLHVFVDETRPLLQGARLTAWELLQAQVPCTLICDSMAAQVMREGRVEAVIVGADRIAANGDTANKIGTYALAIVARHHSVPFYVAAPTSTFDLSLPAGDAIPIEQRAAEEITHSLGRVTAPADAPVYNPAFDVTPAGLITAIITERGVISPVDAAGVRALVGPVVV